MLSNNETMNEGTEPEIGREARYEQLRASLLNNASRLSDNETMNESAEPKIGSEAWHEMKEAEANTRSWQNVIKMHVPLRYREAVTDNQDALEWIRDPKGVLFIYGPVGTGKTHMSWAIVREQLRKLDTSSSPMVMGDSVASLFERMKPGQVSNQDRGTWLDPQVGAPRTPLLLLDDFGASRLTDWMLETMFHILNARYNQLLPTIISSNLMPGPELSDLVGDRIVSRIAEDVTLIPVVGEDRRRR
jgi:DNA replication protein DnaC